MHRPPYLKLKHLLAATATAAILVPTVAMADRLPEPYVSGGTGYELAPGETQRVPFEPAKVRCYTLNYRSYSTLGSTTRAKFLVPTGRLTYRAVAEFRDGKFKSLARRDSIVCAAWTPETQDEPENGPVQGERTHDGA